MAVGCSMPVFRKQTVSKTNAALDSPGESIPYPKSEVAGRPSRSPLNARFCKPQAKLGLQYLGSDGATDTGQQRLRDSEAAARGKGYELLAKAGYKGSGGLGPLESGITSPLPAWHNQGRMGIGSAPSQQPASNSHSSTRAGHLSMGEVSHGSGEGSSSGKAKSHDQRQQQTQKRSKPPHTEWASVRVEEDLQVKVKRVKQVMRAEAEAAADKALAKALYREFNDIGGQHSSDTNPLQRRSKLSASNPLLQ